MRYLYDAISYAISYAISLSCFPASRFCPPPAAPPWLHRLQLSPFLCFEGDRTRLFDPVQLWDNHTQGNHLCCTSSGSKLLAIHAAKMIKGLTQANLLVSKAKIKGLIDQSIDLLNDRLQARMVQA